MNKYLVEFLGTLFFLYVILATGNALAIGAALAIAILVGGGISGGNFNPAVSVMMVAAGKLPKNDLPRIKSIWVRFDYVAEVEGNEELLVVQKGFMRCSHFGIMTV